MRASRAEKQSTHDRILQMAAKLLREVGPERLTVGAVMGAAGLTSGGFYRHFETKDRLLADALQSAFRDFAQRLMEHMASNGGGPLARSFHGFYLSRAHVSDLGRSCPLSSLGGDVARASDGLRDLFGANLTTVISMLSESFHGSREDRRRAATREIALLVGAVLLARASDPATAADIIASCQDDPTPKGAERSGGGD